ncbi:peroxiredoxin [Acidihalobacter aeolianus]|uniref:Peroxiredoxin n=1 Tax=Acidihalobacter aeolianus TaxID=2792603 RepID=A0A1D8KBB7_9GAMM|nr:OsmC family protein [Acidihalobacter aeolianus]AOV18244.1 peroxiredoxin [Acidihalobacter aeolianus]
MSTPAETVKSSVSYLRPIDGDGLSALAEKGKANPNAVVTLKAKTVCEGQFRMQTYVRDLAPMLIDEPPHLLGENNAPNPSEAVLATLGACLAVGVHANATAKGVRLTKLDVYLEGDINVTAVWGTGDLDETKPLGFTDVRVKIDAEGDAPKEIIDEIVAHSNVWSPVANTLRRNVNLVVEPT